MAENFEERGAQKRGACTINIKTAFNYNDDDENNVLGKEWNYQNAFKVLMMFKSDTQKRTSGKKIRMFGKSSAKKC